jgi:hypothetical protein
MVERRLSGIGTETKKPEITRESAAEGRPEFLSSEQLLGTRTGAQPERPSGGRAATRPDDGDEKSVRQSGPAVTFSLRVAERSHLNQSLHGTISHIVNSTLGVWRSFFERGGRNE